MRLLLFIALSFWMMTSSCSHGGHPCPTLSTSPGENDQALVKRSTVTTTKSGLVKKKGVKKVKRR
jgi:hypothetical protein